MAKFTKKTNFQKAKPYKEFPLTAHPSGRWCKKHQGKQYYFGPVDDWKTALDRFKKEWPYILDGKGQPLSDDMFTSGEYTLADLCNEFCNAKKSRIKSGELAARTFKGVRAICDRLIEYLGRDQIVEQLSPRDFEKLRAQLATRYSIPTMKAIITQCRAPFRFAKAHRDIKVDFGDSFAPPSAKSIRIARNKIRKTDGAKMFEPEEVHQIIDNSNTAMRAMILLGLNCGFGNSDVATLPENAIDFETGWVDHAREKTGVERRIPLWPETVTAIRAAAKIRPKPISAEDKGLLFLTRNGLRLVRTRVRDDDKVTSINSVSDQFQNILINLKMNGRNRLGFYTLRHVFQTVGGNARDPDATAAIMGHVDSSMGAVYRERIDDDRLIAVVNTVRDWLWPDGSSEPAG
jgi:integrase